MKTKLVFVGAGGFGREVAWQLEQVNSVVDKYEFLGFIDDTPELQGKSINGLPVIGNMEYLLNCNEEIAAIICIGCSKDRKMIAEKLSANPLISFPTIIACDVQCSDTVQFGRGCIICMSNIFTVNIDVGDFVIVNLDCTVGHDVVIEDYVTLYPSVNVSGNVHIGACTEIGTGTNIIQRKNIGGNSVIGAGSVVVKDIPANCVAVGAPAVPIKYYNR